MTMFSMIFGVNSSESRMVILLLVMMFFNGDIITYHKRVRIPVHNAFKLASRVAPQPYRHANLRALCEGPGQGQREEMTSKK
jgi:hypothetical protein